MTERRANQPVRELAQKWFEALRAHLADQGGQSDVAERLKAWATIEDLLAACPSLLPPLMTMAWQLRHQPAFADLFQTSAGAIAEDTKTPLKPSNKSFDDVVLAQLHGAVRVYCHDQEEAWLAAEKARYKPGPLEKIPILAPLIRRLKKRRDEDVLAHYPQRGLYLAIKPFLRRNAQFGMIESLATLPTATVSILRDATVGLSGEASIRNLAALETRKCKFVTELARAFAETVIESAQAGIPHPPFAPEPVKQNMAEIAGAALSALTRDGLHLSKGAIAVREHARDIVVKMAVAMGYDVWRVFSNAEGALNIARCPPALARALGEHATRVPDRTSEVLNTIPDQRVIDDVIAAMTAIAIPEAVIMWATSPLCVTAWERLATDFKQAVTQRNHAALAPEAISAYCMQLAPRLAALSTGGQPPVMDAAPAPQPVAVEAPTA